MRRGSQLGKEGAQRAGGRCEHWKWIPKYRWRGSFCWGADEVVTGSGDGKTIFPAGKQPEQSTKVRHGKTCCRNSERHAGLSPALGWE